MTTASRDDSADCQKPRSGWHATAPATLLLLVSTGPLWNNIAIWRSSTVAVSLAFGLTSFLFIFGLLNLTRSGRRAQLLVPPILILGYEMLIHGVVLGGIGDPEWLKSFSLLVACAGLLVTLSNFKIEQTQIATLSRSANLILAGMGFVGVGQFLCCNVLNIALPLVPEAVAVRVFDPRSDVSRFGGLVRSCGISYESSFYGTGMVILTILALTLHHIQSGPDARMRRFRTGSLVLGLAGIVASMSLASWALFALSIAGWILGGNTRSPLRSSSRGVVLGAVFFVLAASLLTTSLEERMARVFSGTDNSTVYRFGPAVALLLSPGDDPVSSLSGVGVGLEGSSQQVMRAFSNTVGSISRLDIVNGWSYISATMGWIGLILHAFLLVCIFRPRASSNFPTLSLLALALGYFVIIGRYLEPTWWAFLVLVDTLRQCPAAQTSCVQTEDGDVSSSENSAT